MKSKQPSHEFSFFRETFELMKKSMKGISSRVPVFAQIHELAMAESGLTGKSFYRNAKNLVYGILKTTKKYGLDAPCVDFDVYNIEAEGIGQRIIYRKNGVPDADRSNPLIKDKDDLRKIKTPDFRTVFPFTFAIEAQELFRNLTGYTSPINFTAPFSLAANIRGIEKLLLDLYENPQFSKELFQRITYEVIIPWIMYQKEKFPDASSIVGSDATASIPIINTKILTEWIIPYITDIITVCGSEVYVPNWIGERYLKNPEEMFELKLKVCPNFLEGQDPDVEKLGPEIYKNFARKHNVALVLGIGSSFLASATPQAVEEKVKKYVTVGKEGGRFSLYLCNLAKTTPPENIRTAVSTAHRYGKN